MRLQMQRSEAQQQGLPHSRQAYALRHLQADVVLLRHASTRPRGGRETVLAVADCPMYAGGAGYGGRARYRLLLF